MCIENLLVGMRTFYKTTPVQLSQSQVLKIGNNPSRVGIVMLILGQSVRLQTGPGLNDPVWQVSQSTTIGFREQIYRVEQYGQLITGDIYLYGVADGTSGWIHELIVEPATMGFILSKG